MQRLNGMTFRQLRALQAVSETGTITQAAEILNLTPPAVHTQLKTLEENIGCAMFHRSGTGGFELTAEGRVLLQAQVQSSEILSGAMREIEAIKRGLAGSVTLGVVSTGKYFAPSLVADLKRSHPNIDIHLNIGIEIKPSQAYVIMRLILLSWAGRRAPPQPMKSFWETIHM